MYKIDFTPFRLSILIIWTKKVPIIAMGYNGNV